jgi:hypothetical protein
MALAGIAHAASLGIYFAIPGMYFVAIALLRDRPSTASDSADFS